MSFLLALRTFVLLLILVSPVTAQSMLRIVEQTLATELAVELAQHEADLRREVWQLETLTVPKRGRSDLLQHGALAEKVIWPRVMADSGTHIFFVSQCPLPYSGQALNPDGHPGTTGAQADVRDNSGMWPTAKQKNVPGDGKFDQDYLPGLPQACIGLLDLRTLNLKSWGSLLDKTSFQRLKYREWFAKPGANHQGRVSSKGSTGTLRYIRMPKEAS